ncbi:bacteriocin-associated integral membrane family protein [Bacillus xiapuensis]|uniref:bacteriocin-associated integral membrane family protein n=1 Tax=Bacillus xiapuensis TaxID=2014075 RepID=UPI000C2467A7|nr:DUF1430 domain-containing protein [Bacillus xiapuensis]
MKKALYVLLALVFVSTNLFGYFLISNKQLFDVLYTNNQLIHIDYNNDERDFKDNELIEHIIQFSKENNINISKYSFQSETDLNIYSTNIQSDPNIHVKSGEIPTGANYLSNKNVDSNSNQSGLFSFPLSNWNVHIYDIGQIRNVGLGNEFYLSGASEETIKAFMREFSDYGNISRVNKNVNSLALINISLLMVVCLTLIVFLIGLFYFLIQNRKKMLIQQFWGYSTWRIVLSVPREFFHFFIFIILLLLCGMITFILIFKQTYFFIDYIVMFFLTNATMSLIILIFTMIVTRFIKKFNNAAVNIKGKLPFREIQWISTILKAVVSIILFGVMSSALLNFQHLSDKVASLEYWNQTKDVFRVQVGVLNSDLNENLEADRELNNRLFAFYKEIESKNDAFLIESENFQMIDYFNGEPIYQYMQHIVDESEIYSPEGRNIIIDKNYLDINPIHSVKDASINDQLQNDENTLNILVPKKYKEWEYQIINSYKEWFYFQKVDVKNMYNREIGYQLDETTKEDLNVNIIYTKTGQYFFTFNSYTGDSKNRIKDPIAVIFNENLDTSNIGALATTSLFFIDKSKGKAFENISPALNKTNVTEVNNTVSVYNEANDIVAEQQWLLFQQSIGLFITIIFSVILVSTFIWAHYSANAYQLSLKYLFGYSFWKRNKSIIFISLISNIIAGSLIYLLYRINSLVIAVFLVLIIDLLVISWLSNYLNKMNINKVIKGEHI